MTNTESSTPSVDTGTQMLLRLQYQQMAREGRILSFPEVGFRNYCQSDEDGILWYLLSVVGETSRFCVELGAGDGSECNTANLIQCHQWLHLLVDGDPENVKRGIDFFSTTTLANLLVPRFVQSWITRANVDDLLRSQQLPPVDVFSLDLDSTDYWIWDAITCIRPRIVVLEFNPVWGAEASVTVPYREPFVTPWVMVPERYIIPGGPDRIPYFGASLPALTSLSARKGYRLVGLNRRGFNAFFLREDVAVEAFPAVSPAAAFDEVAYNSLYRESYRRFYLEAAPKDWEWQEV